MRSNTDCSHAQSAAEALPKPEAKPEPPTSEAVAAQAVRVVQKDMVFQARAQDNRFAGLGEFAGAARNIVSILALADPSDPKVEAHLCTGIANQAVRLLKAAHAEGKMPGVRSVQTLERRNVAGRDGLLSAYHTAVALTLDDGQVVVLDWHATLSVQHPKLSTPEAF